MNSRDSVSGQPASSAVDPAHLRCANCGRKPREDENPDDEWRVYSDGLGELHVFCPECWEREFGRPADDVLTSRARASSA